MTRELELHGKHNGDEPIICEIVVGEFIDGFIAPPDSLDDSYSPTCDFSVEGISDEMKELYKDEIQDEVICILAEHYEYKDEYDYEEDDEWDDEDYDNEEYRYFNESGDVPF